AQRPLALEPAPPCPPTPPAPAPPPTHLRLAGEQQSQDCGSDGSWGEGGEGRAFHRNCPTLVVSCTNAVITSWAVFVLNCRSSLTAYAIWSPALTAWGQS